MNSLRAGVAPEDRRLDEVATTLARQIVRRDRCYRTVSKTALCATPVLLFGQAVPGAPRPAMTGTFLLMLALLVALVPYTAYLSGGGPWMRDPAVDQLLDRLHARAADWYQADLSPPKAPVATDSARAWPNRPALPEPLFQQWWARRRHRR